ncbi:MAG: hypothetical protein BroJett040_24460 [Oligoflexia bacterium]|nr:MAG: hypothetical protein BroJett040_24460 [Oligoflexia bacterium]
MVKNLFLLLVITSLVTPAKGAKISLSQKSVAERILQESIKTEEINLTAQLAHLALVQSQSAYDFSAALESGYEVSKLENFTGTANPKDTTYKTSLTLKKPFFTGTTLGVEYTLTTINSEFSTLSTTTLPNSQTQNLVGLTLEQSLWKNSFGIVDRANLRAAENTEKSTHLTRVTDQQNLVLEGIKLFWKAYVAQETLQEAINSRERYEKLVETVKKKTNYGYANPGELAQVQAELETRIQNVKAESVNYLAVLDQLSTLLNLEKGSEIEFQVPNEIPPLPQLNDIQVNELRPLKTSQLKVAASEDYLTASRSKSYPDVSLIGKLYQGGIDEKASESYNEMISGAHPKYYIGVKLSYSFGSGIQNEDYVNKKIQRDLDQAKASRLLLEIQDSLEHSKRKVQMTYAVAMSSKKQLEFRDKAAQELQRAYNQGRSDISLLIDSLNKFFGAQIQYSKNVGDYQIALNEWAALRDELITDAPVVNKGGQK